MSTGKTNSGTKTKPVPDITKIDYYQRITAVPIGEIARELLGSRITAQTATQLECDCPNHESVSKRSLQISLDKGLWRCWGCDAYGDVLQLVEFLKFGVTTVKQRGEMPETHRQARDFLAERAGLPPLGQTRASERAIQNYENFSHSRERTFDALRVMADLFHKTLLSDEKALAWVRQNYGLTLETIKTLKIGLAQYGRTTIEQLEETHGIKRRDVVRTGLFRLDEAHGTLTTLNGRVIFPYWKEGRITFMIGRILPWAKDAGKQPKYKKLPVHDLFTRAYVDPSINNGAIYNEDCMRAKPKEVLITEGVTDCIAAMQQGFAAISPVTVQFRDRDVPHLLELLKHKPMVYICLDNELSGVGLKGALKLAKTLEESGIRPKIITLPLGETQQAARQLLATAYGVSASADPKNLKAGVSNPTPERLAEVNRLIGQSKIDLNAYFAAGNTPAQFRLVLGTARHRVELMIDQLSLAVDDELMFQERKEVLTEVARQPEFFIKKCLDRIRNHYGTKAMSYQTLRSELKEAKKAVKVERDYQEVSQALEEEWEKAEPGSCREAILLYESKRPPYWRQSSERIAEIIFEWFQENGGEFVSLPGPRAALFFENELLEINHKDNAVYKPFQTAFHTHTGFTRVDIRGREIIERIQYMALEHGVKCKEFTWMHTVLEEYAVFFNLNNDAGEIAKITPSGVEIIPNGANEDGVFLRRSEKIDPITYVPDVDIRQADEILARLLDENLACSAGDRRFLSAWLQCFLLLDFAGTRPMTRFEGPYKCGKSNGVKLLTTLLYGEPQQKIDTGAARYADAAANPLTALDNVEVEDADRQMIQFLLTATTKIIREKRDVNSNSGTVQEQAKCLIVTTGIEPLGEQLGEILSRLFTVKFSKKHMSTEFNETDMTIEIRKQRDYLISAIMHKTARVLAMIERGQIRTCMSLLRSSLGEFFQDRANDYLSLMYLMTHCADTPENQEAALTKLSPEFVASLRGFDTKTTEIATEGHPIALALSAFFRSFGAALEADTLKKGKGAEAIHLERFLLRPNQPNELKDVLTKDLFRTLALVASTYRLNFPYTSNYQFAQRFADELGVVEKAGFKITRRKAGGNKLRYTIAVLDDDIAEKTAGDTNKPKLSLVK